MEPLRTDSLDEDDLLPDDIVDQLEAELLDDCLSCEMTDSGPLDDREAQA